MLTRCCSVCALLILVAESSRTETDELDNASSEVASLANTTRGGCKMQDGSYQPFTIVPADICDLMQKQSCCCERNVYDENGNEKKERRGNPEDLLGLCPAHYCSRLWSKPGESCEGQKYAWTCYRTKRVLGMGLGCASASNGKANDSPDLYDRIEMYQDDQGIWHVGVDQAAIEAEKEENALQEAREREEQKAYKAKFAVGNLIKRQPPPMSGITPASEEGVITNSCESEGQVCTVWYYTKKWDSPQAWVQISHQDMDAGFEASSSENRKDRLESLGNWKNFDFDEDLLAEIRKNLQRNAQ
eukprot:TRINITY_DN23051_c0_g2_i1.p1 TRINITY_DN23051_c0_g2~~TRINITY_DN23051_c0_g2_i1.p1  ORF type:complete len:302 (-),score=65.29 TRINITY_DN23051_c0_g2_i1:142-1047(-)